MPTMIVLVNLREGVNPGDYERWAVESYAPAVRGLPSVEDWRNHRVGGLLGSGANPPYRYSHRSRAIRLCSPGTNPRLVAGETTLTSSPAPSFAGIIATLS